MRSDFARLCVLAREGGIYLDVDEACSGAPTDLLRVVAGHELVCTVLDQVTPYANNAMIGSMPEHPVLRACLTEAVRRLLATEDKQDIWSTTGPGLLTRNLVRHLRERGTGGGVALLSEWGWRRLCAPRNSLSYKAEASGNWRLA
jgi:mannosyltransferase OCH1-like enzyme